MDSYPPELSLTSAVPYSNDKHNEPVFLLCANMEGFRNSKQHNVAILNSAVLLTVLGYIHLGDVGCILIWEGQIDGKQGLPQGTATPSREQLEEDLFSPTRGRGSSERDATPRMREQSRTPTSHGEDVNKPQSVSAKGASAWEPHGRQRKPLAAVPQPEVLSVPSKRPSVHTTMPGDAHRPPRGPDSNSQGKVAPASAEPANSQHASALGHSATASEDGAHPTIQENALLVLSRR
jgi:hypothetical protein